MRMVNARPISSKVVDRCMVKQERPLGLKQFVIGRPRFSVWEWLL